MQTKEEVEKSLPLYSTKKSIEELHKDIMSDCNFLRHELYSQTPQYSSQVTQKSAISKLKALFINSAKVFLAQYQMFWLTEAIQPIPTRIFMSSSSINIEMSLRCMLDLSTSPNYYAVAEGYEDSIYLVLGKNFLDLANIFVCPYFDFMHAYGFVNHALINESYSNHYASADVVHNNIMVSALQPLGIQDDTVKLREVKEVPEILPLVAMQLEVQQPQKNWVEVVGSFLNSETVPGVSTNLDTRKESEEEEKSISKNTVREAQEAQEAKKGDELNSIMGVAYTLPLDERSRYLNDVKLNFALQAGEKDSNDREEEEALPVSKLKVSAPDIDEDGFTAVRRKGSKSKKMPQTARPMLFTSTPHNPEVTDPWQGGQEFSSADPQEHAAEEEQICVNSLHEDELILAEPAQEYAETIKPTSSSTVLSIDVKESLVSGSIAPDKVSAKQGVNAGKKRKQKQIEKKPVDPIEELKSALFTKKTDKWNDKYLGHEVVAAELHDYVIDSLARFSSAEIIDFVNQANLPVKILLSILQFDKSDLSIRKAAFVRLLATDDFVGFYLYIEQKKSMIVLRKEYIHQMEAGNVDMEDFRSHVSSAMAQVAQMKTLIEVHVTKLIENVTDKVNAERLACFAQHQNSDGQTPLMRLLVRQGEYGSQLKFPIVHYLLPASDIFAADLYNRRAFHYACKFYNSSSGLDIICILIKIINENKPGLKEPFRAGLGPDAYGNSFLHHVIMSTDNDTLLCTFLAKMMTEIPSQLLAALLHANHQCETVFHLLDIKSKPFEKSINLLCQFMVSTRVKPGLVNLIKRKMNDKQSNVLESYTLFAPRGKDPLVDNIRLLATGELTIEDKKRIFKRILWIMDWRHALRWNLVRDADDEVIIEVDQFVPHYELIDARDSQIDVPGVGAMLAHEALVMTLLEPGNSEFRDKFIDSGAFGFYEANTPYTLTLIWRMMQEFVNNPKSFEKKVRDPRFSTLFMYLNPIQWQRDPNHMLFVEYAIDRKDLPLIQFYATFKRQGFSVNVDINVTEGRSLYIACQLCAKVDHAKQHIVSREYMLKHFKFLLGDLHYNLKNTESTPGTDLNVLYLPVSLNHFDLMELFFANLAQDQEVLKEMMLHCSSMCKGRTAYQVARKKTAELGENEEAVAENKRIYELFEYWADELGIELAGRDPQPANQQQATPSLTM